MGPEPSTQIGDPILTLLRAGQYSRFATGQLRWRQPQLDYSRPQGLMVDSGRQFHTHSIASLARALQRKVPKVKIPSRFVHGIALLAAIVGTGSLALGFKEPATKSERGGTAVVTNQKPSGEGRLLTIEAKPGPIGVDLARTAIVVVDMQNDFGAKIIGGKNLPVSSRCLASAETSVQGERNPEPGAK